MSLERVLFQNPWIQYNNTFLRSRLILQYPQNIIFTAQLLDEVTKLKVYTKYPYAEQMNVSDLQTIKWETAIIVFNHDLQLVMAPKAVQRLISLDRRLNYQDAASIIFGPFRWPFVQLFKRQSIGIFFIVAIYAVIWLISVFYKKNPVLIMLPKKVSNVLKLTSR